MARKVKDRERRYKKRSGFSGFKVTERAAGFRPVDLGGENRRPVNAFRMFRREFQLDAVVRSGGLRAYAEFRYKLYINGRFVLNRSNIHSAKPPAGGSPRGHPFFKEEACNAIAFLVHCPGIMTGQWTLCNPGLLCCLWDNEDRLILASDWEWKTLAGQAWRHPTELCGYGKGWSEWHVVERMPEGWTEPGFDDRSWEPTRALQFFSHGRPEELEENYVG